MKIRNIKFLAVFLVFSLCGCSFAQYTEPENRIYATALGIDKTTAGYLFTCETADHSSANLAAGEIFTGEGDSLQTAFLQLKTAMHKNSAFSKCPVVFIGSSISKTSLYSTALFLLNQKDFSFSVRLALTDNANRLLNTKMKFSEPKGVLAYETIKKSHNKGDSLAAILNKNSFSLPVLYDTNGIFIINETKDFYEE